MGKRYLNPQKKEAMSKKVGSKLWEWQQRAKKTSTPCPRCHRYYPLSVDHIVPLSLVQQLVPIYGFEDEENFEIVCITCNKYKAERLDLANPKTIPLLKKYIQYAEDSLQFPQPFDTTQDEPAEGE